MTKNTNRQKVHPLSVLIVALFITLLITPSIHAEDAQAEESPSVQREPVSDLFTEAEEAELTATKMAESTRRVTGSQVGRVARWVDSFFDDPNYMADAAGGRFVLKQSVEGSAKNSTEYRMHLSGKLRLPELSHRIELIFEDDRLTSSPVTYEPLPEHIEAN